MFGYSLILDGGGISTPLEIDVYDSDTSYSYSLEWFKMGDGSYRASDRGIENDHIETEITIKGKEDYIDNIITQLKNNQEDTGILELVDVQFPIFGQNVDYDVNPTAVMTKYELKQQRVFNSFVLKIKLLANTLTFKSYTGLELPTLKFLKDNYSSDTALSFSTVRSYTNNANDGNITINRFDNDNGIFSGTWSLTYSELGQFLDFVSRQRAFPFQLPTIEGVPKPFGILGGVGPHNVRLKEFGNIKRISAMMYEVDITFVQDYS